MMVSMGVHRKKILYISKLNASGALFERNIKSLNPISVTKLNRVKSIWIDLYLDLVDSNLSLVVI